MISLAERTMTQADKYEVDQNDRLRQRILVTPLLLQMPKRFPPGYFNRDPDEMRELVADTAGEINKISDYVGGSDDPLSVKIELLLKAGYDDTFWPSKASRFIQTYSGMMTIYSDLLKIPGGRVNRSKESWAQFNRKLTTEMYILGELEKQGLNSPMVEAQEFGLRVIDQVAHENPSSVLNAVNNTLRGVRAETSLLKIFSDDYANNWLIDVPYTSADMEEIEHRGIDFVAWNQKYGWLFVDSKSQHGARMVSVRQDVAGLDYREYGINGSFEQYRNKTHGDKRYRHLNIHGDNDPRYTGWFGQAYSQDYDFAVRGGVVAVASSTRDRELLYQVRLPI